MGSSSRYACTTQNVHTGACSVCKLSFSAVDGVVAADLPNIPKPQGSSQCISAAPRSPSFGKCDLTPV